MNRKVLLGVAISLLVAASFVAVGIGAFRAGQRDAETVQVVGEVVSGETAGRTIVVSGDGWNRGWDGGPGPGFLLFPLLVGGVILLVASRRGRWYGPGRYGDDELREWHRRAHEQQQPSSEA